MTIKESVESETTRTMRAMLTKLAPDGAHFAALWPYDDCRMFTKGDVVWYRTEISMGKLHYLFYRPVLDEWLPSIRPNILKDAQTCSISIQHLKNTPR